MMQSNAQMSRPDNETERLDALVHKMESEAKRRVDRRGSVERRWLSDLRQYHGKYDETILAEINRQSGSQVFLNLTRPKTNAMIARLSDLLFPTDDRNWGIQPTPVPEMADTAEESLSIADDAAETFGEKEKALREAEGAENEAEAQAIAAEMQDIEEVKNAAQEAADDLHETLNEAKRRSNLMQEEITDQLKECKYQAEARDAIEDACKLGIGVLKGPVLNEKTRRSWQKGEGNLYQLNNVDDNRPGAQRVDPWSFFPDPEARTVEDCEGFYERHLMTKAKLRKFARRSGVNKDAVRQLLKDGANAGDTPAHVVDLNNITDQNEKIDRDTFIVWEYTGAIEAEDLELLAETFEDQVTLDELDEADPLTEFSGKVWFCQGKLLSFALHPLDSQDPIYSVFQLERDEASLFGFGIPYLLRDPQSILNASLRMMMDNAGLGTGPQVVINQEVVKPQDGDYTLRPRKVWLRDNAHGDANKIPFETYNIEMHQNELGAMVEMSRAMSDEVTAMPQLAQGEQGSGVTKTAQGMALLMNSANIVFRRVVKNYDDDVTVPMISRFYDWNMQFSQKDEIKGDYEVDARGSSVLLVREMQANNLMMIAERFGDHPIFGPMIKHVALLRQIFRAHMLPADEVTKTDREIEREKKETGDPQTQALLEEQQRANELKARELDLKQSEIEMRAAISEREMHTKLQVATMERDAAMSRAAEDLNEKAGITASRERIETAKIDSSERKLATEAAMAERLGKSGGGRI